MSILGLDNQGGLILLYVVYGLSLNVFLYTAYVRSIRWRSRRRRASTARARGGCLPLVILSDPDAATIQLAQYIFQGQFTADYTLAFASYLVAMAPLLIVYVLAQRWVISGVTRGAVK